MHTRQGVAVPAQSKDIPAPTQVSPSREASSTERSSYEQDAQLRQAVHDGFWSREPLTPWQEFILCRELRCTGRPFKAVRS